MTFSTFFQKKPVAVEETIFLEGQDPDTVEHLKNVRACRAKLQKDADLYARKKACQTFIQVVLTYILAMLVTCGIIFCTEVIVSHNSFSGPVYNTTENTTYTTTENNTELSKKAASIIFRTVSINVSSIEESMLVPEIIKYITPKCMCLTADEAVKTILELSGKNILVSAKDMIVSNSLKDAECQDDSKGKIDGGLHLLADVAVSLVHLYFTAVAGLIVHVLTMG